MASSSKTKPDPSMVEEKWSDRRAGGVAPESRTLPAPQAPDLVPLSASVCGNQVPGELPL